MHSAGIAFALYFAWKDGVKRLKSRKEEQGSSKSRKVAVALRQDFVSKINNVARGIHFPAAAPNGAYLRLTEVNLRD